MALSLCQLCARGGASSYPQGGGEGERAQWWSCRRRCFSKADDPLGPADASLGPAFLLPAGLEASWIESVFLAPAWQPVSQATSPSFRSALHTRQENFLTVGGSVTGQVRGLASCTFPVQPPLSSKERGFCFHAPKRPECLFVVGF